MLQDMDLYAKIRHYHEQGWSDRRIAEETGLSRPTVHKYASGDNMPGHSAAHNRKSTVMTEEITAFIDEKIEDNKKLPKKQRYTAKKIYDLLCEKKDYAGAESAIRNYVHQHAPDPEKIDMPLKFRPGEILEIDWGEVHIILKGVDTKVYYFCARLGYSNATFSRVYRHKTTESLIEALMYAFAFFGGVTQRVLFDNDSSAVASKSGKNAVAVEKYSKFAAHYAFQPDFCNVRSGNEKGLAEIAVRYVRRNFLTPLPNVNSLEELNKHLEECCRKDMDRTINGRPASIREMLKDEQKGMNHIPECTYYDFSFSMDITVSTTSTVTYATNSYSVPWPYSGKTVTLHVLPEYIRICYKGTVIAEHERCYDRFKHILDINHYKELLEAKGRAIFNAEPVINNNPEYFLDWLQSLKLTSKETVRMLMDAQKIGCDAVIQRETVPVEDAEDAAVAEEQPAPPIYEDVVGVDAVDISAYDALMNTAGRTAL